MRDFRTLRGWEKSHQLVLQLYQFTKAFPKDEMFGITSQIRRADGSVPANIAEGCGRHTNAEFPNYLQIAMGSASELEYHLLLAHDLGYITKETYEVLNTQTVEVKQMLAVLLKKVRNNSKPTAENRLLTTENRY